MRMALDLSENGHRLMRMTPDFNENGHRLLRMVLDFHENLCLNFYLQICLKMNFSLTFYFRLDPRLRTKQQKSQNQRQMKQCVNKDWNYPERGGRLSQVVIHLSKLCKGYIDRPTYQCRCLQRQKILFWNLMKSRRVCASRKREHDRQQAKKENKNKSRKR